MTDKYAPIPHNKHFDSLENLEECLDREDLTPEDQKIYESMYSFIWERLYGKPYTNF